MPVGPEALTLVARVLVGFLVAFWLLPRLALPVPAEARTGLDRAALNLVRWMGLALFVGHLLAAVRLFHLLPIGLLVTYGWLRKRSGQADDGTRTEGLGVLQSWWLRITDLGFLLEQRGRHVLHDGGSRLRHALSVPVRWSRQPGRLTILLLALPALSVFAWSLWTRLELAARFATLGAPRSYVMLTWTKTLLAQSIYPDGVYPAGQAFFLALIGKATPGIDTYEVVRFVGPLQGALLVAGLYYAVVRLSRSVGAAMVAATAFGVFGTAYLWHEPWVNQTVVRAPELGLVVILFVLPSLVLSVTEGGNGHLLTVGAAALGTALIHPVPAALLLVVAVAISVGAGIVARPPLRQAARVVPVVAGGLVLGQVPPLLAVLLGKGVHRGLDNPYGWVTREGSVTESLIGTLGTSEVGHTPFSYAVAAGLVLALVVALTAARRGRPRLAGQLAGLVAAGATGILLYDVRWTGLADNHLLVLGNLTGVLLALALGAAAAGLFTGLEMLPGVAIGGVVPRLATYTVLGAVLAVAVIYPQPRFERTREESEYEAMAAVTREIMQSNEAFGYTIIGTPQQAQAVAGSGSFVQLWVFARDVTLRDARDPGFVVPDVSSLLFARDLGETLPIPTQNIYLFVEKNPFPVVEQPPVGPSEEYYYDREKRGRIMALVYAWAEYYRHYHTDMDVYYEDENVIVYRIRRRPNTLVAAASPQFKDYTWREGVLFERGPSEPSEVVIPWRDA